MAGVAGRERRARWRGALLAAALGLGVRVGAAAPRPNLLLVTADDLNADSPGWMGNPLRPTPRIDALAATAHRFVNAHVTAPICQPSRAVLLTGRVPHRSGALGFDPIADDVPTLVEVLRGHGYFTAAINKLGHMQPAHKFPWDLALRGSGRRPRVVGADVAHCLAAARRARRPFFLNVNLTDPHRPFRGVAVGANDVQVPGFLEDVPGIRRELAHYFASVARLDASLGEVLDALAAAGHDRDTIVVFLSDNGASFPFAKASVYRHGTWSPVILRHAGSTTPAVHEELVSSVDLMPTLLELLDVPPPAGMDGRSWGPLLRGEPQDGRDVVVTHVNTVRSGASYPQRGVRTHTRALLFQPWADGHATFQVEAMRGLAFPALVAAARHHPGIAARVRQLVSGVPLALYDLERDPDERDNVIDVPAYGGDVEQLVCTLLTHMQRTDDPLLPRLHDAIACPHEGASLRCGRWQDAVRCEGAR
jgi:N-sulfoglucosamine sulfohydrolase